ncbi:MAG: hypothetical protein M3256_09000 [Actinomycetota bacterium]|nr:hypothetical protein [Actinomycetota bacterium]
MKSGKLAACPRERRPAEGTRRADPRQADGLTTAQRAIREAAEGLRNGTIRPSSGPSDASGNAVAQPPATAGWPPPSEAESVGLDDDSRFDETVRQVDARHEADHFRGALSAGGAPFLRCVRPDEHATGCLRVSGRVVRRDVVVRESGSAPVAIVHVSHHRHEITEGDGDEVRWCWRAFSGVGDDETKCGASGSSNGPTSSTSVS